MKLIKVIYDNSTEFIVGIVKKITKEKLTEYYNIDDYKQKKKALPIMTRHGTKKVPLIVFADENLQEVSAIWSEQKPDWNLEILKQLNN